MYLQTRAFQMRNQIFSTATQVEWIYRSKRSERQSNYELSLTHFELYKQIGIDPPRGMLKYGPPGCGKTVGESCRQTYHWYKREISSKLSTARAVKKEDNFFNRRVLNFLAAFIRVVGSGFVQKYLNKGPRMVRDVFRLVKENSSAIIFVDEIDAIATKRFDAPLVKIKFRA